MKIFLLGYMGSGKSFLGEQLSAEMNMKFIDLDELIVRNEGTSISEIFQKKGEVYFRRVERKTLEDLIELDEDVIVALGGGTPCYGNNMQLIKDSRETTSVYLKLNINTLTDRLLQEKDHRPMISHLKDRDQLLEFIGKHLFERNFYYNQSDYTIDCSEKSAKSIIGEIQQQLK
ncbi:shikimate kinase [Christiangramia sabulilitoris]|uniref:Shikimate kinase n=1 Tax=Christiangramia sabulilitoris TaxID=2583991 RepID=A0A550I372_9FLAO|nr:shikimate kinase [Christiangramia sabulilitoris]TRO65432.1 shikimate kinase [Christiangramia sabulilitoris]